MAPSATVASGSSHAPTGVGAAPTWRTQQEQQQQAIRAAFASSGSHRANGVKAKGVKANGAKTNGVKTNGVKTSGVKLNGAAAPIATSMLDLDMQQKLAEIEARNRASFADKRKAADASRPEPTAQRAAQADAEEEASAARAGASTGPRWGVYALLAVAAAGAAAGIALSRRQQRS